MTYLEILSWARKGISAEKAKLRDMQDRALAGQALDHAGNCPLTAALGGRIMRPSEKRRAETRPGERNASMEKMFGARALSPEADRITDQIRKDYGSNAGLNLRLMNGEEEYYSIIDKYGELLAAGPDAASAAYYALAGETYESAMVKECYNALCKAALNLWLSKVSRDQMIAICNSIGMIEGAHITIFPDMNMNVYELAYNWSEANPDQPKITPTPGISV